MYFNVYRFLFGWMIGLDFSGMKLGMVCIELDFICKNKILVVFIS